MEVISKTNNSLIFFNLKTKKLIIELFGTQNKFYYIFIHFPFFFVLKK